MDYIKFIIDESRAEGRDGKRRREIFLPIILRSRSLYPVLKSKLPTLVEGRFWDHNEQDTHLSLLSMFSSLSFCPMSTCSRSIASCSSECDVIRLSIVLESLALFSRASLSERCKLSIWKWKQMGNNVYKDIPGRPSLCKWLEPPTDFQVISPIDENKEINTLVQTPNFSAEPNSN